MTSERDPFYTPPTKTLWGTLKPLVRHKRTAPTSAEDALWPCLRGKQIAGMRFRRQHAVDRYIVDFYCAQARLIIEVDGSSHDGRAIEDAERQAFLEAMGLRVMRFTNEQVAEQIENVIDQIRVVLSGDELAPSPRSEEGENVSGSASDSPSSIAWGKGLGDRGSLGAASSAPTEDSYHENAPDSEPDSPSSIAWGKGLGDGGSS